MRSNSLKIMALSLVILTAAMQPVVAFAAEPDQVIRSSNEKINNLLRQEARGGNKAKLELRMKKVINQFLDFDALALASMRRHWSTLTDDQRAEFTKVFRELIEANYIRRLRKNLSFQVTYGQVARSGSQAKVPTVVEVVKKGRKTSTRITYKLGRKSGQWMVNDVVTNDVSLADNYRRSFHKIIRRHGFAELIKRMHKKIKRLKKD